MMRDTMTATRKGGALFCVELTAIKPGLEHALRLGRRPSLQLRWAAVARLRPVANLTG